MIRNFYRETDTLSKYEEEHVLPKIVSILEACKGRCNALTNKKIIEKYGVAGREMESRVRKVINYIRNNGIIPCLIATNSGYHIATDAKEITDYEDSLKGRESAIRKIRLSLHKQGLSVYGEDAIKQAAEETKNDREEAQKKYKLTLKLKREQKKKKKRKSVLRLKPKRRYSH